jgi:hypothetical protein
MFGIWCEVWGGVTGHRAMWLKADGKLAEYATREEADAEAQRLNKERNSNPYRKADFSYTAKPL